eukprot:GHVR01166578.1.p3 GENE.GHVR01166578.1~~GHVR01166578.1.p3  ORF type:complete len:125 (+),score=15.01 GHVR01166578.1:1138-1512(+)
MFEDRVQAAVRLLMEHNNAGPMECTPEIIKKLKEKHPPRHLPHKDTTTIPNNIQGLPKIIITDTHIQSVTNNIQGGSGPGGTDATHWKDSLTYHGESSERLRKAVAKLADWPIRQYPGKEYKRF